MRIKPGPGQCAEVLGNPDEQRDQEQAEQKRHAAVSVMNTVINPGPAE
jgi:hypothetical protein